MVAGGGDTSGLALIRVWEELRGLAIRAGTMRCGSMRGAGSGQERRRSAYVR